MIGLQWKGRQQVVDAHAAIAAMAANLNASTDAVYAGTWAMAKSMIDAVPAAEKDTPEGRRAIKVTS